MPYLIANILIVFDDANIREISTLTYLFGYINQSLYYFTKKHQRQVANLQNKQPLMRNKNKQKCRELYTIESLFTTPCAHTQKKQCRIDTAEGKEPCKQGKTARLWGKGKLFHSDSNGD